MLYMCLALTWPGRVLQLSNAFLAAATARSASSCTPSGETNASQETKQADIRLGIELLAKMMDVCVQMYI